MNGAWGERLREAWAEIRSNLGRSVLQSLGVMLGVAAVLGGFSITDSMRKRSDQLYIRMGGLDKLSLQPNGALPDGPPSALQQANLGLRDQDATDGRAQDPGQIAAVSVQRNARARVRSAFADQDRAVTGVNEDYFRLEGYEIAEGRPLAPEDIASAAPVAVLGASAAQDFFPMGGAIGATVRVGDVPVRVVGVLKERVFKFRASNGNMFRWKNRIVAVPASLVQRRMQGDLYRRADRVTFRVPNIDAIEAFSQTLKSTLIANHRQQDDVRMDDIAARMKKRSGTTDAYNIIFMLSGVLALLGGGLVNVNIQLASLKERVREVGVKMAIGAPGSEVFKAFLTEALLLTLLGGLGGLLVGIAFSWAITAFIGVPLGMSFSSFAWAYALALVFGLGFALYPAWKASRLSPMEALRYE